MNLIDSKHLLNSTTLLQETMTLKNSPIINKNTDKPLAAKSRHYVNNKDLLAALVERRAAVEAAKAEEKPIPRISEYIGTCISQIANNLGKKRNFAAYRYKDEMIQDGILVCIKYLDNFDPAKSSNPFSYFTQICTFAMIARIQSEKKQTYIKFKSTMNSAVMNELATMDIDTDNEHLMDNVVEFQNDYMEKFIDEFETKKAENKAKSAQKEGLELFVEDYDDSSEESIEPNQD